MSDRRNRLDPEKLKCGQFLNKILLSLYLYFFVLLTLTRDLQYLVVKYRYL